MAYNAVKCFWVEPTGKWRLEMDDGQTVEIDSDVVPDDYRGRWRSLAPLFLLPDGRRVSSNELPPGALYEGPDYFPRGFDGRTISAVCPDGHHWCIDSRANNCTRPEDGEHRCWIREGDVKTGLTVSKGTDEARTCKAGGGSIQTALYHGMLQNGAFTAG